MEQRHKTESSHLQGSSNTCGKVSFIRSKTPSKSKVNDLWVELIVQKNIVAPSKSKVNDTQGRQLFQQFY